jgi:hypothetical protein
MSNAVTDAPAAAESLGFELLPMIEGAVAEPLLEGMPLGPTLTDAVIIELLNENFSWSFAQRWKDRVNWWRYWARARKAMAGARSFPPNRVLVTWRRSTPRADDLIRPVIEELGPQECNVIYQNADVLSAAPRHVFAGAWHESVPHDPAGWSAAFGRCWPEWKSGLKRFCAEASAPLGAYERLAVHALQASILLHGSLEFLRRNRPSAIVTEYDRGVLWSCLVLAARRLGIPTFSVLHGVLAPLPKSFHYGLADYQLCWGDQHRQNFIQSGEDPARLLITGCPRLTRELPQDRIAIRQRLGLDPQRPVVMLGTSPVPRSERLRLGEVFCEGMKLLPAATAMVRLHPSELLTDYDDLIRRNPAVSFVDNRRATLDEALAAADIVAVQNSGFGADALVKRRLAVVIDTPPAPLGYGLELIQEAGCPRVTTPREMASVLESMLFDSQSRTVYQASAERYVERFCAYFGRESARKIVQAVREVVASAKPNGLADSPRSPVKQELPA